MLFYRNSGKHYPDIAGGEPVYDRADRQMAFFSDTEIREHSFSAVYDAGRQLQRAGRVGDIHSVGKDLIATVNDGNLFRVVIGREEKQLRFSCSCVPSHAGACRHAVAAMLAANGHAAIQVGIDWEGSGDSGDRGADPPPAPPAKQSELPDIRIIDEGDEGEPVVESVTDYPPEKPLPRLYLSEREGMLLVEIRFAYFDGNLEFTRNDSGSSRLIASRDGTVYRIFRSRARETAAASSLTSFDLMQYQTGVYTPSVDARDWTLQQLPQLSSEGYEIYGQELLQSTQARKSKPVLGVTVASTPDDTYSCTITMTVDGVSATLAALITAIRQKSRYILLSDGSSAAIPQEWLDTFATLFAAADKRHEGNMISFKSTHISLAEALCDIADHYSGDEVFERKKEQLHTFGGVTPQPLPDGFGATLREYQQAGYNWFYFLKEFRFGGCLADDMGLGKTVQTLALLLREKQLGEGQPSLVVVPNSLLFNWQRETSRFASSINLLIYHGNNRHTYSNILYMADVILTTYGTVLRDCEALRKTRFHYVILDEAQAIKNPNSRISKAVRSLNCRHRLALSGTPIENNLSELWSLVSFLNPGMAGGYNEFVKEYIKPIEREMNETRLDMLKKMVYPILLRRTKVQVAKDLPPKSEIIVYAEMLHRQRTLYEVTKELYYGRIKDSFARAGVEGTRMELLEGMLRLRQICCHPQLYDHSYTDDSGKYQLIEEELHDAVSEGHRVLVFSQFVSALELLRERLRDGGLHSELLTGATRDRQKVVDRFQNGQGAPIFLISLKAGGTGLNLTAADYVFHLDPWWNPSVENQASDRAYRIGQTKPVFVYKLITQDSVEERVLELQEKKRLLAGSIIQTEQSFFKHLNKDDLLHLFE